MVKAQPLTRETGGGITRRRSLSESNDVGSGSRTQRGQPKSHTGIFVDPPDMKEVNPRAWGVLPYAAANPCKSAGLRIPA
jgi:hypothetical protein